MLQCAPTSAKPQGMLELGVKFLLSYFIGSVMGAMVMGRLYGGVDIREMGSGNAGGTNALRTQGFAFAIGVVIIDVGKGILGAAFVPGLDLPLVGIDPALPRDWVVYSCAVAAVAGHVWPIYHNFRGGKGAATYIGTLIVLAPVILVLLVGVFALVLVVSGFVGLSTMTAAVALPVWIGVTAMPAEQALFWYLLVMALFIVWCHRSNIRRMRDGEENRNPKVMLFRRAPAGDDR